MTIFHEVKASFILMKESAKNLITNLERKLQKEIQNNGKQIFVILTLKNFLICSRLELHWPAKLFLLSFKLFQICIALFLRVCVDLGFFFHIGTYLPLTPLTYFRTTLILFYRKDSPFVTQKSLPSQALDFWTAVSLFTMTY